MTPFLSVLGVTCANRLPFCREFTSLTDLRDEFILYLPSTLDFDNVRGTRHDEGAPYDNDGGDDESQSPADIMQERVVQFQQAIVAIPEEDGAVAEEEGDDNVVVVDEAEGAASNSTLMSDEVSTTDEYAQLMIGFQAIVSVTSGEDILSKVVFLLYHASKEKKLFQGQEALQGSQSPW